jgi:hypothetical protein
MTFHCRGQSLEKKVRNVQVILRQVIAANVRENTFELYLLARNKKKKLSLVKIEGTVNLADRCAAEQWVEVLMNAAYKGILPSSLPCEFV